MPLPAPPRARQSLEREVALVKETARRAEAERREVAQQCRALEAQLENTRQGVHGRRVHAAAQRSLVSLRAARCAADVRDANAEVVRLQQELERRAARHAEELVQAQQTRAAVGAEAEAERSLRQDLERKLQQQEVRSARAALPCSALPLSRPPPYLPPSNSCASWWP